MSNDKTIAHEALALARQIERDRLDQTDDDQTIADRMIEKAARYRDLLKPFDDRTEVEVPMSVGLAHKP